MERMSMQDARFFYLEDDNVLLHIGACAVLEGPAPSFAEFSKLTSSKLGEVRRFRQVAREVLWGLGRPVWIDDHDFRVEHHVSEASAAEPGDDEELQQLVGEIMGRRLDRSKPLWDSTMVRGLSNGRWAVVIRAHHSMVDGVSGAELLKGLLDIGPDVAITDGNDWIPRPTPSDSQLALAAAGDVAAGALATLGSVASLLSHPREVLEEIGDVDTVMATPEKFRGGQTSALSGPIGPDRCWLWTEVELDTLRRVRQHHGATINDVVLAAVTGGFRELLLSRGVDLEGLTLRTIVPFSTHDEEDSGAPENHVSSLIAELPVGLQDPVEWLAFVSGQMSQLKATSGSHVGSIISDFGDLIYRGPIALASRSVMPLLERVPALSIGTVTTNIPGPQFPLYCLGRRVEGLHPFVPVLHGIPIAVAVLSYDGRLSFGLTADRPVTDLRVLADGLTSAVAMLDRTTDDGTGTG